MVTRRLDADERIALHSGCVYAWEERGPHSELTGLGIERFTEGRRWTASRVREEFLFYYEKYSPPPDANHPGNNQPPRDWDQLVKQTYSVWVETGKGRRKWHLTAYFTPATYDQLGTVDDIPSLRDLVVPEGTFTSTRTGKSRTKTDNNNRTDATKAATNVSRTFAPFPSYQNQAQNGSPSLAPVLMHEPYQNRRSEATQSPVYEQSPSPDSPENLSPYIPSQVPYSGLGGSSSSFTNQNYTMSPTSASPRAFSPAHGSRPYPGPSMHVSDDLSPRPSSWDANGSLYERPMYQHRNEYSKASSPYSPVSPFPAADPGSSSSRQTYYPSTPASHMSNPSNTNGNNIYSPSYSLQSALNLHPLSPDARQLYPLSPLQIPDRLPPQSGSFSLPQSSHTHTSLNSELSVDEGDGSHEASLAPLDVLRRPVRFPRDPTDEKTLRLLREKRSST
ncbi:hypothetical protein CPB84DRAFT_1775145 [Gymnopilus junonius]|uniref:Uncharacterized protein n=1 Tax=Gymnopilus junonius TaxID=109634 RepID=A0A9P5NN59_GYMJU|nr:hypothetical protein CPB84DRAFT_1775145 [Gymnopilus junonius]